MTFAELHDGIEYGCDCITQHGVADAATTDTFTRLVSRSPIDSTDFSSYFERRTLLSRPIASCAGHCKHRGVSINRLNENKDSIKESYTRIRNFSPQADADTEKFVCVFKVKAEAGKIWDTSNNKPENHHTLLKGDGFELGRLDVLKVVAIENF